MWPKVIIFTFLVLILYNLGAGLYYMIVDKGRTKRTVNALSWRVGLSVALVVLLILGIWTGMISPHGVGG
ncbi:MAG TPA: twin transmembrane helix small protein [Chiayiivirga sp.]|jgi:succinate dehydrogenase/fumarate reductase cytochrome b subunit|uniref:Twin transmembrane helix small protein n=1 Tax=Denitratimonas tolerans TaxID=1338420 RepID=A0AAW9R500_9GAMM|nr:twin transmembrane helix small protein [Xanthomonadaceae bacterium]MDX9763908.1 twin transmembrane helix small protein [Chiayiivirga sp.]HMN35162.1 twin transmembrane helix small protein [Chiayiivirga sp.]HRN58720.1 twin transmembrane helix small protein [Chiayiivirga sp.]HRP86523.1 twin transmembrane helix small protein [Gammaproteobacteria bacterium]